MKCVVIYCFLSRETNMANSAHSLIHVREVFRFLTNYDTVWVMDKIIQQGYITIVSLVSRSDEGLTSETSAMWSGLYELI